MSRLLQQPIFRRQTATFNPQCCWALPWWAFFLRHHDQASGRLQHQLGLSGRPNLRQHRTVSAQKPSRWCPSDEAGRGIGSVKSTPAGH